MSKAEIWLNHPSLKVIVISFNTDLKRAKLQYYENLFSRISDNSRKVWQAVNDITDRKNTSNTIQVTSAQGTLSDETAAEALNAQFIRSGEYVLPVGLSHTVKLERKSLLNSMVFFPLQQRMKLKK